MLTRNPGSRSSLDDDVRGHRSEPSASQSESDLGFWRIVRWRAKLVVACILAAIVVAGAALMILPPRYKATSIVLIDPRQPRVTNNEVISGIGSDAAAVESQVELITSSGLAARVIDRLKLAEDADFTAKSLSEKARAVFQAIGLAREDTAEGKSNRLIYKFQANLTVRRRGLTYVLEINYVANDPVKAALISRTIADVYLDDQRAAKMDITTRASGWLGERLEAMREKVRDADRAVADYKAALGIVDVTQGNKLISRQIEDLTQQLALARAKTADAQARLIRVEELAKTAADPATLAESLQSAVIANLRSQYAEAARLQSEYSTLYGERHPSLMAVRSQLVGLRRQIDQEIGRIISGIRNDHRVALDREKSLENELAVLKEESAKATQSDVRLHELEREAQATRALFEKFLLRARETTEQQSLQLADARIVSAALPPPRQDRPPVPVLLAAAAVGGGVLGFGLILLMEQMRRGIRNGAEIENLWPLPYVISLPMESSNLAPRSGWRRSSAAPKDRSACLFTLDSPASPYAASLQALRARLQHSSLLHRGDAVAVVSALPEEGKSTFVCNYARMAARSGTKTLLIDTDFHNASATKAFNVAGPGLCEVLDGKCSIWNALKQSPQASLSILGVRDLSTSQPPYRDFSGADLDHLLNECRAQFDLIIIDCPAVLSTMGGTLPSLQCADRAILLVRWEKTDRQAVSEALATLGVHSRKIMGVILNMVPANWYRLFDDGRYRNYYAEATAAPTTRAAPATAPSIVPINAMPGRSPPARQTKSAGFRL